MRITNTFYQSSGCEHIMSHSKSPNENLIASLFSGAIKSFLGRLPHFLVYTETTSDNLVFIVAPVQ